MTATDEEIEQIVDLYDRAQDEHRTTNEKEYWQGRKDGIRLALAILQPNESIWKQLNKSSYGFRKEEHVIVREFMKDARYNIAAALVDVQEKKKIHSQTKINLIQWLDQYDRMSKSGITLEIDDAVDSIPNFRWTL